MDAIRKIITLKDNVLSVVLPERFRATTIELIVLPSESIDSSAIADRESLLDRYAKQYEKLRFNIRELKYDRDELHGRD